MLSGAGVGVKVGNSRRQSSPRPRLFRHAESQLKARNVVSEHATVLRCVRSPKPVALLQCILRFLTISSWSSFIRALFQSRANRLPSFDKFDRRDLRAPTKLYSFVYSELFELHQIPANSLAFIIKHAICPS